MAVVLEGDGTRARDVLRAEPVALMNLKVILVRDLNLVSSASVRQSGLGRQKGGCGGRQGA